MKIDQTIRLALSTYYQHAFRKGNTSDNFSSISLTELFAVVLPIFLIKIGIGTFSKAVHLY